MFQTNQATFFLGKSLFFEGAKSLTSFDPLRYQSTWLLKKITEMGLRAVRIWTCQ